MGQLLNGGFSEKFARNKKWKIDKGLLRAIREVIPQSTWGIRTSVVDLGAGAGQYVQRLREAGYGCRGVDATPGIGEISGGLVRQYDLTGAALQDICHAPHRFDWAISIEVGEHIPSHLERNYFRHCSMAADDGLIVSWAVPGQRGKNHINCRTPEYVASRFGALGWIIDEKNTATAREAAGKGWNHKLLVFTSTLSKRGL